MNDVPRKTTTRAILEVTVEAFAQSKMTDSAA
jgi:hypothetical protein